MLITPDRPDALDAALHAGQVTCPGCDDQLRPWGWARKRVLRETDRVRVVRPRRGRCRGCGVTHVLLAAGMLLRRAYAMSVIGPALEAAGHGVGHRRVAAWLGLPAGTVRGWIRRLRGRQDAVAVQFTGLAYGLDGSLSRLEPLGGWRSGLDAAMGAVGAAAVAFRRHLDARLDDRWQAMSAVTSGLLLANTSCPFPSVR